MAAAARKRTRNPYNNHQIKPTLHGLLRCTAPANMRHQYLAQPSSPTA